MTIPELIKNYRTSRRLTLQAAGDRFGVTRQAIMSWESGDSEPGIAMLNSMCASSDAEIEALGLKIAAIKYPLLLSVRKD